MDKTLLVCSKCGRTAEVTGPNHPAGWLVHQRKNQPAGYLIIRCPEHVTGHALKVAGLPQDVSKFQLSR